MSGDYRMGEYSGPVWPAARPPVQGDLFDAPAAQEAKAEAIQRVADNADAGWVESALLAVETLSNTQNTFTTDDVWRVLLARNIELPHEPRAMGAVMNLAVKRSWCAPTDRYVQSIRVACHSRPLRVWRSLLRGT